MAPLPLLASPSLPLDPGQWSIVTRQQMSGAAMSFAPRHHSMCLTPSHAFPGVGDKACHPLLTGEIHSNFVWRLHCTSKGTLPASGQAVIHYQDRGKRLKGQIELLIAGRQAWLHSLYPIRLILHEQLKGHRTGPCDKPTDLG